MRGHVRKRGEKRGVTTWEIKLDADRVDGRRKTIYGSVKCSKREAQAELAKLITQIEAGAHVASRDKLSVVEHVRNRVALWRGNGTITARTAQGYEGLIKYQIASFPIASRPLQKLTSADVETWHTTLRTHGRHDGKGGVSHRLIHHAHKLLAKALREGVRHGLVLRNVATEQRPPKINAKPMRILTPDQVKELPAQLDGLPICAPAIVALCTGMRRGELLALLWSNVGLDQKVIKVRSALEHTKEYGIRFKGPKTEAGVRSISLPDIVVETLQKHRRQQLNLRLALGVGELSDDALVFPFPGTERPWNPDAFSAAWNDVAPELGLDISFHGLRHTHASMLIAAKVPITEIAKRLGHASPTTTLQIYAHMFEQDDSNSAAAINVALAGAQGRTREVK